jgi:hypothetical protein
MWALEATITSDLETGTRSESLAAALEASGTIFIPPLSQEAYNWWKKILANFPARYSDQVHGVDFVFFTDRSPNKTLYAQINGNIVRQIIARQTLSTPETLHTILEVSPNIEEA